MSKLSNRLRFVVVLLFFSVIQFPFSLVPTNFLGVGDGDGRQFRGVDFQSFNRFEIDELIVGEMKREPPHFTRFIPSVGFVGVIFWSSRHEFDDMFSMA